MAQPEPAQLRLPRWARWGAASALALGLLLRAYALFGLKDAILLGCDGRIQWDIARNLAAGKGFLVTDAWALPPHCLGQPALGPSHHYSPLMPAIEAAFVGLLGPGLGTLHLAVLAISVAAVAAAYLATRDHFGPDAALLVGACASADWTLILWGTRYGYAESLVFATFTLTLWAIVRSLRDPPAILWAGLFAGLGYLSKASAGWFFLIAVAGGLAWRLAHHGRNTFRDRWYLAAGTLFVLLFALWSLRNIRLFWDGSPAGLLTAWQTSPYASAAVLQAVAHPLDFASGLAVRLPVLLLSPLPVVAALAPELRRSLRAWRTEETSGLWLAAGLLFLLGWLFAAAFYVAEADPYYWLQPVRYAAPAQVPLLWIALRQSGRDFPAARWLLLAALLVAVPLVAFSVYDGAG